MKRGKRVNRMHLEPARCTLWFSLCGGKTGAGPDGGQREDELGCIKHQGG